VIIAQDSTDSWTKEPTEFRSIPFNSSLEYVDSVLKDCESYESTFGEMVFSDSFLIGDCNITAFYIVYDNRFVGVSCTFSPNDYFYLKDVFITKFGPPHFLDTYDFTAAFGSKFTNETLVWVGKNLNILFRKYPENITESSFSIHLSSYSDMQEKASKEQKANAENSF
jgi:hypothetical protein